MIESNSPALYWDSTYAIAMALIDAYPEKNPDEMGLHELAVIVPELPGFKDYPELANERILTDIQIAWYEELTNE